MGNDAVRDSRAGDIFHYRWAARRCLRMVNPNSNITRIVIEGSNEPDLAGEYVMDVTEYSEAADGIHEDIAYFQLKHSSKRVDQPFKLSELENTITGFANRYRDHLKRPTDNLGTITFSIITNRPLSDAFKDGIQAIVTGNKPKTRFLNTLKGYTQLVDEALQSFCALFKWADDEGNFADQKNELHFEMAAFFAGNVEHEEINNVIELVQKQVLPSSSGKISPENVLMCLGATRKENLFPAPPKFEPLSNPIQREQHAELLAQIVNASEPIIIHAGGGVGKSVVCQLLADDLPTGSVGIVYDCFGSGEYLNRIHTRHRYRDALIQVANELAVLDLCELLIPRRNDPEDDLLRAFLRRLDTAGKKLQQANPNSILVIFIDAADNAEMAAAALGEQGFVPQLLRQKLPIACRIIALCRTERINLLNPNQNVQQLHLLPFSQTETLNHLRKHFPNASADDGSEFHRLTGGNPRVQANAINFSPSSLRKVLTGLGPGRTVEEQIATQLETAIAKLIEQHPLVFQQQIDAICRGLANLHPFIPIEVLAAAAGVDSSEVKSFVADLGRPLWLSDNSVQFRDEPTETWFRQQFSASPEQIATYINRLKALTTRFNYVAEVLPILLLRSENYAELIPLALSDELLPESPIDKRNVRVYRLQFAFKAALKQKHYADAAKLALRAGEEMAGDKRQLELLRKNTDLIAPLQSPQRVQELAFRRMLDSAWQGSENVYSAALLSSVEDFKGEARSYLKSANNWLKNYLDERKKDKTHHHNERLKDEDIVELVFAHLNLFGIQECVDYIASWRPPEVGFRVTRLLVGRLIDAGQFVTIDEMAELGCRNIYLMLAITDGLIEIGKFPPITALQSSLVLLKHSRTRINKTRDNSHWQENSLRFAIVSFAEACVASGLCFTHIQRILRHYLPTRATYPIYRDHADSKERSQFVRSTALKALLSGNLQPDFKLLMPEKWLDKQPEHERDQDIKRFEQIVGSLLPWYLVRAQLLFGGVDNADALVQTASQQSRRAPLTERYQNHDRLPFELTQARFECLVFNRDVDETVLNDFIAELTGNDLHFSLGDRLNAIRTACRLGHLSSIRKPLERSCKDMITSVKDEGPESLADSYIQLARAVLPINPEDAKAYFDEAIEVVSKFSDELVDRWQAIVAAATRTADGGYASPETAYRFIRCAELVGNKVAREKYWDRDEAIETCFKLHPTSAFAALSRWRDRDIGWLGRQLPALVQEAIKTKQLAPAVGWSLAVFAEDYGFESFAALCIEFETDNSRRQIILDHAVRDLRLRDGSETNWQILSDLAQRFSLKNRELERVLAFYAGQVKPDTQIEQDMLSTSILEQNDATPGWKALLAELDPTSSKGLSQAIDRFKAINGPRSPETFWREIFSRVPENKASQILDCLVNAESADELDIEYGLSVFPSSWRENISVQKTWPKAFHAIGRRFPGIYSNYYRRIYYIKRFQLTDQEIKHLNQGIVEGLANSYSQANASTLFGFSHVVSAFITPEQATDVLDFGLKRFEEHIDDHHADGHWAEWLTPPESVTEAVTYFIWSALGSPRSAERWQAAHAVRRLVETGCAEEIDALISWMAKVNVAAFGSHKYPFYNLHARLYLLIAIARAAMDVPQIFLKHHAIFAHYALNDIPHTLIEKFATDIALLLEAAFPNTYEPEVIMQLRQVGVSPFPPRNVEGYGNHFVSPWHERGEVDNSLTFSFAYDFDQYWFEPLGDVFGLKSKQVEELAREIVFKHWDITMDGQHARDPRQNLWRSDPDAWQSHSDYPKIDNYQFYLSYHAMLMVAAKLLQTMPVIHRDDWNENEWWEWLETHLLTRSDNRWLADRRDPTPMVRRAWLQNDKSDTWHWKIVADDFLEGLLLERDGETWLNVFGSWNDNDSNCIEQFYIASAFVHPETSSALLIALTTCSNPREYKIPDYQKERMEFNKPPFQLEGWIYSKSQDKRLDEYDPFAGDLSYPPYQPGESTVEQFGLFTDCDQRNWYSPDVEKPVMVSELWGDKSPDGRDSPVRQGNRISASLGFLTKACSRLGRDLIIEVQIKRRYAYNSYRAKTDDEVKYPPPYSKVYLLSADGKLRDAGKSYQLRESLG